VGVVSEPKLFYYELNRLELPLPKGLTFDSVGFSFEINSGGFPPS
jgi:hypothetical protein